MRPTRDSCEAIAKAVAEAAGVELPALPLVRVEAVVRTWVDSYRQTLKQHIMDCYDMHGEDCSGCQYDAACTAIWKHVMSDSANAEAHASATEGRR